MGSATVTELLWLGASFCGVALFLAVVVVSWGDTRSVPKGAAYDVVRMTATSNFHLFLCLFVVEAFWSMAGLVAAASAHPAKHWQSGLILAGLLAPSIILPIVAVGELLSRRQQRRIIEESLPLTKTSQGD